MPSKSRYFIASQDHDTPLRVLEPASIVSCFLSNVCSYVEVTSAFAPRAVMNAIRKVSKSFFISFFLCVVIGLVAICCGVGALPFTVAPYSLLLLDNILCGRTLSVVVVVVEVDEASPQLLHGKNSKKISLRKQKSSKRENFNKIFIFYRNRLAGWGLAAARPAGSLGFNRNYRNRSYRNYQRDRRDRSYRNRSYRNRSYRNYQSYRSYRS